MLGLTRLQRVDKSGHYALQRMPSQPVTLHTSARSILSSLERRYGPPVSAAARLPPPSSFAFVNLMSAIDSEDIQSSIDAIGEICARSSLSLADAHDAHRPPLGEITTRPRLTKMLTSVPEVNSSSEGPSPREEVDLMDDTSTQWLNPAAAPRHISLSNISGLARLKVSCTPTIELSSLAVVEGTPLQR